MVIYKTVNLVNGKIYVGKDYYNDPHYFGSGVLLKQAISKYGKENFVKEILVECLSEKELNEQEKIWISKLKSSVRRIGYNIAVGGFGGDTFTNQPKERKEEIRRHLIESFHSKVKVSDGYRNRGKKISKTKKGMIFSNEHKRKLSESHKGKIPSNKGMKFPLMSKLRMGEGNPMYGKHTSEKQKSAVSRATKLRWIEYRKSKV